MSIKTIPAKSVYTCDRTGITAECIEYSNGPEGWAIVTIQIPSNNEAMVYHLSPAGLAEFECWINEKLE